jgi:hypothetical protein
MQKITTYVRSPAMGPEKGISDFAPTQQQINREQIQGIFPQG